MINWKRETTADTRTHVAFSISNFSEDTAAAPLGAQLVHRSRTCSNCALYFPGGEIDGKPAGCEGYLPSSEAVCVYHMTVEELGRRVSRLHRPALNVVGGIEAPPCIRPKKVAAVIDATAVRVVTIHTLGANGARNFAGTRHVHVGRTCSNCAHDGAREPEWFTEGGLEKFGRCMNLCSAADDEDPANQWCDSHQTWADFEAGVQRPSTPIVGT